MPLHNWSYAIQVSGSSSYMANQSNNPNKTIEQWLLQKFKIIEQDKMFCHKDQSHIKMQNAT